MCERVERAISEIVSSATVNHNFVKHLYSLIDSSILARWTLIKLKPIHGFPRVNPVNVPMDKETAKWSKPEKGWVKINFDGASKGNPGISGV